MILNIHDFDHKKPYHLLKNTKPKEEHIILPNVTKFLPV